MAKLLDQIGVNHPELRGHIRTVRHRGQVKGLVPCEVRGSLRSEKSLNVLHGAKNADNSVVTDPVRDTEELPRKPE